MSTANTTIPYRSDLSDYQISLIQDAWDADTNGFTHQAAYALMGGIAVNGRIPDSIAANCKRGVGGQYETVVRAYPSNKYIAFSFGVSVGKVSSPRQSIIRATELITINFDIPRLRFGGFSGDYVWEIGPFNKFGEIVETPTLSINNGVVQGGSAIFGVIRVDYQAKELAYTLTIPQMSRGVFAFTKFDSKFTWLELQPPDEGGNDTFCNDAINFSVEPDGTGDGGGGINKKIVYNYCTGEKVSEDFN